MDLLRVERELKKRLVLPYKWGRKQSNDWDSKTNFIYTTYSYQALLKHIEKLENELKNYALNRWFNYWSAMAVENIFATHNNIKPNKNIYDKLVDFKINNIPFDHKTSVFPKGFNQSYEYAQNNKTKLITWLYNNQSQEGRKHLKNRLFIVLYDSKTGEHWKMKSEVILLKNAINNYVHNFSKNSLVSLNFNNEPILSDIIWIKK